MNTRGIELYSNSIIEAFLWENRKAIELIKVEEKYEIYNIKDKNIMLYITNEKSEKRCFNSQICLNLSLANRLDINTIELMHNKYIFM